VHYPGAAVDPDTGQLISDAEVAEVTVTAFASTHHPVTARLVVHRVRTGSSLGLTERRQTVSAYLDVWLTGKVKLRASTKTSYEQHIRDYLKPGLGHIALVDLRADDIAAMMAMIRTGTLQAPARRHSMHGITTATARRVDFPHYGRR
jgi:hypothetical protein